MSVFPGLGQERKEGGSSCWPGAKLSLQRRATNYGLKQPQRTSKVSWERGIIILGMECGMSLWGNIMRTAQWKATLECLAIEDNVDAPCLEEKNGRESFIPT